MRYSKTRVTELSSEALSSALWDELVAPSHRSIKTNDIERIIQNAMIYDALRSESGRSGLVLPLPHTPRPTFKYEIILFVGAAVIGFALGRLL